MSVQCRQVPLYLCISGHYMFIETNTRQGRVTILRSPEVKVTQRQCLKFHYMGHGVSGAHGRLQLFRNFHPYQKHLVWNATPHTVRKWISAMLDLPAGSYYLTFEGRRSAKEASSYSNSIAFAIDDVELMPGGCTEQCKYHYYYCRTHSVRVCLYIAYVVCGSSSLYIKTLYFFSVLWCCQQRLRSLT